MWILYLILLKDDSFKGYRKKILKSLQERFKSKITDNEESKDVDKLKLDEFVDNMQTYEANHNNNKKISKKVLLYLSNTWKCWISP